MFCFLCYDQAGRRRTDVGTLIQLILALSVKIKASLHSDILRKVFRGFVESVCIVHTHSTWKRGHGCSQQPRAGDGLIVVVPVVLVIGEVIEVVADRKAKALCISLWPKIRGKVQYCLLRCKSYYFCLAWIFFEISMKLISTVFFGLDDTYIIL